MHRTIAVIACCLVASPAVADAVTYKGTIGTLPVILELSDSVDALTTDSFGRYSYLSQGVDIPVHVSAGGARIHLAEEVPCLREGSNCPHAGDSPPADPPLGPMWTLASSAGGASLHGLWESNGKHLPVALRRLGSRPFEPDSETASPADLAEYSLLLSGESTILTPETSPYDWAKMQVPMKLGPETSWSGSAFRDVTDPRTLFAYPRITRLGGGADPKLANGVLEQRDWRMRLDALNCKALAYQGMGWNETVQYAAGTLGDYDSETMEVTYLSPTVMSWTESGSLFCGGAHPYNHHSFLSLDVRTGETLDLSRIFKDWVAFDFHEQQVTAEYARAHPDEVLWRPDAKLAAFVKEHRDHSSDPPDGSDDGCGIDDLIDTNLAISFIHGERVLFALDGLSQAGQACGDDLYEAPLAELRPFLTSEAADYFPSLALK